MSFRMVRQDKDYTEDEILRMVAALRGGDREQIVPLIKAHITLANKIAGYFTRHNVNRREDLYAVAFHGLCDAVNKADKILVDNNLTAYAARTIKGAIQMFLVSDCLIPIPRGEFRKRMEKEDPISFCLRTNYTSNSSSLEIMDREVHAAGIIENMAFVVPLSNKMMENIDVPVVDHTFQKMEDLYAKMGLTEQEIAILDLRLEGFTFEEIGARLGMSFQAVRDYHMQNIKSKIGRLGIKTPNHAPVITAKKACSRCGIEQSLSFFYKIGEGKYKSICKNCTKESYEQKTACVR